MGRLPVRGRRRWEVLTLTAASSEHSESQAVLSFKIPWPSSASFKLCCGRTQISFARAKAPASSHSVSGLQRISQFTCSGSSNMRARSCD